MIDQEALTKPSCILSCAPDSPPESGAVSNNALNNFVETKFEVTKRSVTTPTHWCWKRTRFRTSSKFEQNPTSRYREQRIVASTDDDSCKSMRKNNVHYMDASSAPSKHSINAQTYLCFEHILEHTTPKFEHNPLSGCREQSATAPASFCWCRKFLKSDKLSTGSSSTTSTYSFDTQTHQCLIQVCLPTSPKYQPNPTSARREQRVTALDDVSWHEIWTASDVVCGTTCNTASKHPIIAPTRKYLVQSLLPTPSKFEPNPTSRYRERRFVALAVHGQSKNSYKKVELHMSIDATTSKHPINAQTYQCLDQVLNQTTCKFQPIPTSGCREQVVTVPKDDCGHEVWMGKNVLSGVTDSATRKHPTKTPDYQCLIHLLIQTSSKFHSNPTNGRRERCVAALHDFGSMVDIGSQPKCTCYQRKSR